MSWKNFKSRRVVKLKGGFVETFVEGPPRPPRPPLTPKDFVKKTEMGVGVNVVNAQPDEVIVQDYMKLQTGLLHKYNQVASDLKTRVAYCGHREPSDWNVTEIVKEIDFKLYEEEEDNESMFCPDCRERLGLETDTREL